MKLADYIFNEINVVLKILNQLKSIIICLFSNNSEATIFL